MSAYTPGSAEGDATSAVRGSSIEGAGRAVEPSDGFVREGPWTPGERESPGAQHAMASLPATDVVLRAWATQKQQMGKTRGPAEAGPLRSCHSLNCNQKAYFPNLPRGLPMPVH